MPSDLVSWPVLGWEQRSKCVVHGYMFRCVWSAKE